MHRFGSRIFVKVTLPKGSGTPVSASDLINEARRPDNTSLDEKLLKKTGSLGLIKVSDTQVQVVYGAKVEKAAAELKRAVKA